MNRQEVCVQIVKCLENVWSENILFDFAVQVQGETIQCHRLILAACSEFFRACFRSGMRETTENCVILNDVSCDVFQLILKALYTGINVLTLENFMEVWRTVHLLQIHFMVQVCEEFAVEAVSMDTWEGIYAIAKLFESKTVLDKLHSFMLSDFEQFSTSPRFLHMSFKEVHQLISSDNVVVNDEEIVLSSVIRWVEFVPENWMNLDENLSDNHDAGNVCYSLKDTKRELDKLHTVKYTVKGENSSRKAKLTELLKEVRIFLVSPSGLSQILTMDLVLDNINAREMIIEGCNQAQMFRHGLWLFADRHRSFSRYIHACVYTYCNFFFFISANKQIASLRNFNSLEVNIQLVSFDHELYATGKQQNQANNSCKMFTYNGKKWVEVMDMPGVNLQLVSHKDFIYILNRDDHLIYNVNPKIKNPNLDILTEFPENADVQLTMVIENFLLLFCSEDSLGIEETAIYQLDILSKVWTRLDNLTGPAKEITTFRNERCNYILQKNGCMWLILHTSKDTNLGFRFLAKLWNFENNVHGALTSERKLLIFENPPRVSPVAERVKEIPDHFGEIEYKRVKELCSKYVPITMHKSYMPFWMDDTD